MKKNKSSNKSHNHGEVRVSILGGVGEIGKNLTVVEQNNEIILVDLGRGFLDNDAYGVEGQIPDITYIRENIKKVKGIILTHGHEDHIGGIEYYLKELKVPIYGTPLTTGLVEMKLTRRGVKGELINVVEGEKINIGSFEVEFIKVTHSIGGACAINIKTNQGNIFFTGDYKLDNTPIDGKRTNMARIASLAQEGINLMLGESTNVERFGYSVSEKVVGESLKNVFANNKNKRIIIATFASSNYRIQQILNVAQENKRKVFLAGTSMKKIAEIAGKVGELLIPKDILVTNIKGIPEEKLVVLATGSQGQELSALSKMSHSAFPDIAVGGNDVIVLSSSPIPGNEKAVYGLINRLFELGANVIYEESTDLHVSGHAYREEIKSMISLVNPQFLIPIHGEYRHLLKHRNLAVEVGVNPDHIKIPQLGDQFVLNNNSLKLRNKLEIKDVYVDAKGIVKNSDIVEERKFLAAFGFITVLIRMNVENLELTAEPFVFSKGFDLTDNLKDIIINTVAKAIDNLKNSNEKINSSKIVAEVKKYLKRKIYKGTQLPVLIPIVIED